jgi:class 3 adenylate cyclase/tetratricopeptide (TPR) repeat protein
MTSENVTVLFTDMVGSTALASSLDADAADELRRGHFAMLRQSVVEAGGTEVKTLGDGLMVVFGSASAALSCAVAMQQGIEREGRTRELRVGLRVGLSAGEVSHEDGDFFGEPVIEAARLCDRCVSGQVLAADIVRLTAGRRSRHNSRSVGLLDLKGLPDPVETVEVLWEPLLDDVGPVVPLPARLAVRPVVGVVGRETELSVVLEAFKRVAAGGGREVLLVSGEAGLGKTTLLAEAARVAFAEGACVLFGHCEEDLATPYQLFTGALGHLVTHARHEQLAEHVESWGPELALLVPALASRLPGLQASRATDADTERYQVFAAVVGLLDTVSQAQPVVLVLDDLQWADRASLQLLQHVLAVDHPMRVLVLGTYRDAELSRAHPLNDALAGLHRSGEVGRLELAGLDDAGIVSLMEAAAGHALDDTAVRLARALHRETDGNPFFVSEVLRHLAETGAITHDAVTGRWVATATLEAMALPASVRTIIGARVGRLGPDAERVLSLAAVIGRDFDLDVLAAAAAMAHDDVLDILDAAAAATLVRELTDTPGHYTFAHALIQHTLYEDLGATRRARAHRRVAEALEELYAEHPGSRVGELARHWHAAQPADPAKALDYSQRAGDAALAALAPGDALRHYAQALTIFERSGDPDPLLGIDLAIGIGTAQRQWGDAAFRETLLDAARRAADIDDTDRLVAAALANNRGMFSNTGNVDRERVAILELALDRLPTDDPSRALVLSTLCAELTYDDSLERRQRLADEALDIARATGDDATTVRVLNHIAPSLAGPHLLDQSLAWTAEGLEIAERLGDPVQLYWAAHLRAGAALSAGDIDETDRCWEIAWSVAERLDEPMLLWQRATMRSLRAQLAGDNDAAEALTNEAFRIATDSGQPDAGVFLAVQQGAVALQRGIDAGDLTELLENMARQLPNLKPAITSVLAVNHVEMGRLDDAHQLLRAFAASGFALSPDPGGWFLRMVNYASVAVACRDTEIATAMFDRLDPFADRLPIAAIQALDHISLVLGDLARVLGRYDEAESCYARAAKFSERAGAKFLSAKTHLGWAGMLIERDAPGDPQRARDLLRAAHTVAAANGYAQLQRQAADTLRQLA